MSKKHCALDVIAFILLIIGGLNWLAMGVYHFDFVATFLGGFSPLARGVYILVGLAAIYGIIRGISCCKKCCNSTCAK